MRIKRKSMLIGFFSTTQAWSKSYSMPSHETNSATLEMCGEKDRKTIRSLNTIYLSTTKRTALSAKKKNDTIYHISTTLPINALYSITSEFYEIADAIMKVNTV